jgi:hypothetical protein
LMKKASVGAASAIAPASMAMIDCGLSVLPIGLLLSGPASCAASAACLGLLLQAAASEADKPTHNNHVWHWPSSRTALTNPRLPDACVFVTWEGAPAPRLRSSATARSNPPSR